MRDSTLSDIIESVNAYTIVTTKVRTAASALAPPPTIVPEQRLTCSPRIPTNHVSISATLNVDGMTKRSDFHGVLRRDASNRFYVDTCTHGFLFGTPYHLLPSLDLSSVSSMSVNGRMVNARTLSSLRKLTDRTCRFDWQPSDDSVVAASEAVPRVYATIAVKNARMMTPGTITAYHRPSGMYITACSTEPGDSGSPVYMIYGGSARCVGLHEGAWGNMNAFLPLVDPLVDESDSEDDDPCVNLPAPRAPMNFESSVTAPDVPVCVDVPSPSSVTVVPIGPKVAKALGKDKCARISQSALDNPIPASRIPVSPGNTDEQVLTAVARFRRPPRQTTNASYVAQFKSFMDGYRSSDAFLADERATRLFSVSPPTFYNEVFLPALSEIRAKSSPGTFSYDSEVNLTFDGTDYSSVQALVDEVGPQRLWGRFCAYVVADPSVTGTYDDVIRVHLKADRYNQKKISARSFRSIQVPSILASLVQRCFAAGLTSYVYSHPCVKVVVSSSSPPAWKAVMPASYERCVLDKKFKDFSTFGIDYTEFDGTTEVCDWTMLYDAVPMLPSAKKRIVWVMSSAPFVSPSGCDLGRNPVGNPSGNYHTSVINSVRNVAIFNAFSCDHPNLAIPSDSFIVCGDDSLAVLPCSKKHAITVVDTFTQYVLATLGIEAKLEELTTANSANCYRTAPFLCQVTVVPTPGIVCSFVSSVERAVSSCVPDAPDEVYYGVAASLAGTFWSALHSDLARVMTDARIAVLLRFAQVCSNRRIRIPATLYAKDLLSSGSDSPLWQFTDFAPLLWGAGPPEITTTVANSTMNTATSLSAVQRAARKDTPLSVEMQRVDTPRVSASFVVPEGFVPHVANSTQKTKKKKKNPGPQTRVANRSKTTSGSARVSIPAAKGSVRRTKPPVTVYAKNGTCTIRHSEFVADVNNLSADSGAFHLYTYAINPGLPSMFRWLAPIATAYEYYRFKSLTFRFATMAATTMYGEVMLAIDYDALDLNPDNKQEMAANQTYVRVPVWNDSSLTAAPSAMHAMGAKKYTRSGTVTSDLKTYDVGKLLLAVKGYPLAATLGELYVDYEVELSVPQASTLTFGNTFSIPSSTTSPIVLDATNIGSTAVSLLSGIRNLSPVVLTQFESLSNVVTNVVQTNLGERTALLFKTAGKYLLNTIVDIGTSPAPSGSHVVPAFYFAGGNGSADVINGTAGEFNGRRTFNISSVIDVLPGGFNVIPTANTLDSSWIGTAYAVSHTVGPYVSLFE